MSKLDKLIPPSETVLWRWPAPRKVSDTLGWLAFYAVGAVAGWVVWVDFFADDLWSGAALSLATPAAIGAAGKAFGVLLWEPHAIAVTGQRIAIVAGRVLRRTETVYRDAIHTASLYEDNTLVLHSRYAEVLRLADLDKEKAIEFIDFLDVPTAVWRKRKPGEPVRAIRRKTLAATLLLMAGLAGGAVALAGPWNIAVTAVSGFQYLSGLATRPGAVALTLAGSGAALFALWVAQMMLHDLAAVVVARYRASPEVLRELICSAGDPLWLGWPRDPKKAAIVSDTVEFLNDWAKILGARPVEPIPLEPEYRESRTEAAKNAEVAE